MVTRAWMLLAVSVISVGLAEPANACCTAPEKPPPDPCLRVASWVGVSPVFTVGYPGDGILLVRFGSNFGGEPTPGQVDFAVSLDGAPIPGSLELLDVRGVLGWRPQAPFLPKAIYQVEGSIANPPPPPGLEDCVAPNQPFEFEFAAWGGPMAPLVAPALTVEEKVSVSASGALDNLVCCDGAFPYELHVDTCSGEIITEAGSCLQLNRHGELQILAEANLPEPWQSQTMVAAQWLVDGVAEPWVIRDVPGELSMTARRPHPFCAELVLRNLATGETLATGQQCHGDGVADQLGPQVLDPASSEIAEHCDGPTYRCEIDECGDQWLSNQCTPWPPETGTTGEPTTDAPTTDATGPGPGESSGSSGSLDTGPAQDDLVEPGCACGTHEPAFGWLLCAAGLGLACPRRRRS